MLARFAIPFFFLLAAVVVPAVLSLLLRWLLPRRIWKPVAYACTLSIYGALWYGCRQGFDRLEVRHVEVVSADLPAAFDGYRIVQFSDAHVGTFTGSRRWLLQRDVDSINAQGADAIVFTGDVQNIWPSELEEHIATLRRLQARDGVYSVLGNHDYAVYQDCPEAEQQRNCQLTQQAERRMGWTLLLNDRRIVRRGADSIVIAGMENWGKAGRMPRRGDVRQTLAGIPTPPSAGEGGGEAHAPFVVMLQHDPSAWRELILPDGRAQLTLSGHTHGGQFAVGGWSPVAWSYSEWGGLYRDGGRWLHVSTGMGGLIPFRLGQPAEIVVITLRKGTGKSE